MTKWATQEQYYSGQGVVLTGVRGADGKPKGLRPVGNVSALTLAIATTVIEHQESTTGQRGIDLRLTTQTKATLSFTLENFKGQNLADALRGDYTVVPASSVVDQASVGYPGLVTAVGKIGLTALTIKQGATALTPYVDEVTPWDFKTNLDAGSYQLNDGVALATAGLGETITAVTVGATTSLAVANSGVAVGELVLVKGFGGADAAFLNGKYFAVLSKTSSAVVIDAVTTGKTITVTAGKLIYGGVPLLVSYSYGDQVQVDALTHAASELYMRFEGLNTADGDNPVIVEVFRFLTDPLKELALIGDTVQQFVLEGNALADVTRPDGSKYFNVQKLS